MDSPYNSFVVVDVETGGLISQTKKAVVDVALTEIALVLVSKELEIIDQTSFLIKPYKEGLIYDKGAEEASGISREMCAEQGVELATAFKGVTDFLKKAKQGGKLPVILGHNFLKFDAFFIENLFEFCKEDMNKYMQGAPEDTIKWARLAWPQSNNYKLGTCCDNAGVTLKDAHRALTDTIATAHLWIYFMKRLRGEGQITANSEASSVTFRASFEL